MELYFLGDEELVTAFRFIGIDGLAVKDADEAIAVFRKITEDLDGIDLPDEFSKRLLERGLQENNKHHLCQVLIMTEETADWLGDYIINWQLSGNYPLVVEIPGLAGRLAGRKTLVDAIREAIGIHV